MYKSIIWVTLFIFLANSTSISAATFFSNDWCVENLRMTYFWDIPSEREPDFKALVNSNNDIPTVVATQTYAIAFIKLAQKMGLPAHLKNNHGNAFIQIYPASTNDPNGNGSEYPAGLNIINYEGPVNSSCNVTTYGDNINAHFFPTEIGLMNTGGNNTDTLWYASTTSCLNKPARRNGVNTWVAHIDKSCNEIYQERYTDEGYAEFRINPTSPIYSIRANNYNDLDVYRGSNKIFNVKHLYQNETSTNIEVKFETRDFETNTLYTEVLNRTLITGDYTRNVTETTLASVTPTPTLTPTPLPTPIPSVNSIITKNYTIKSSADDAEELQSNGSVSLNSSDLELTRDSNYQTIGLRFTNIDIPKNITIHDAYIQFTVDETSSEETLLTFEIENNPSSASFSSSAYNISNRLLAKSNRVWNVSEWLTVGQKGANQLSPDLGALVQELISNNNWDSGDNLTFIIKGTGKRVASSFDKDSNEAPKLIINYSNNTFNKFDVNRDGKVDLVDFVLFIKVL